MENYLFTIFFIDILVLMYLLFKYMKALNHVVDKLPASGGGAAVRNISSRPSKLALLSDFKFALSLYTKSYLRNDNVEFINAMDQARRYLIWQAPFAVIAFLLPIVSAALEA